MLALNASGSWQPICISKKKGQERKWKIENAILPGENLCIIIITCGGYLLTLTQESL